MPVAPRLNVRDYYDLAPHIALAAGDIWSGLPTFGLIPGGATRSIVVTPACDLSNRKVETATYLPIIPLRQYLQSPAFVPVVAKEVNRQLEVASVPPITIDISRFVPPADSEIESATAACEDLPSHNLGRKAEDAARRAVAGLKALKQYRSDPTGALPRSELTMLFGAKAWSAMIEQIVRNSFRQDLFFLPHDEQRPEYSAVPEPSVVLFRYPLCTPIHLLECAQDVQLTDWDAVLKDLVAYLPGVRAFAPKPLKHATLRGGFLSDMLTRFASMHVRLGTPDLSTAAVEGIVGTLIGVQQ